MILKEAFTMQNFLTNLISQAQRYLYNSSNTTKTVETHLRKKANPNAEDETIETPKEYPEFTANDMIDFIMDVLCQKEILSQKISSAKYAYEKDIDNMIAMNKQRTNVLTTMTMLANVKPSETVKSGKDYLINAEGNQTPYTYQIKQVTTIDFNRQKVKAIAKELQKEINETSAAIDLADITIEVNYEPKYELGDDFEECYEKFVSNN